MRGFQGAQEPFGQKVSRGRAKSPSVMEVSEEQERSSDWRVSGASTLTSGVQEAR